MLFMRRQSGFPVALRYQGGLDYISVFLTLVSGVQMALLSHQARSAMKEVVHVVRVAHLAREQLPPREY